MVISVVEDRTEQIAEICRRHHVQRLCLFGSAAIGPWDPETSDLDFLVTFDPAAEVTYVGDFARLQEELNQLFERPVDLVIDRDFTRPEFRTSVEQSRTPVYEA